MTKNPYKDLYEKTLALNTEYRELLKAYKALLDAYVTKISATFTGAPSSGSVTSVFDSKCGHKTIQRTQIGDTIESRCLDCGWTL